MDTKTTKQIAKELAEQAKKIREIANDHKKGILSDWAYNYRLNASLKELETTMEEFKYELRIKNAINKSVL